MANREQDSTAFNGQHGEQSTRPTLVHSIEPVPIVHPHDKNLSYSAKAADRSGPQANIYSAYAGHTKGAVIGVGDGEARSEELAEEMLRQLFRTSGGRRVVMMMFPEPGPTNEGGAVPATGQTTRTQKAGHKDGDADNGRTVQERNDAGERGMDGDSAVRVSDTEAHGEEVDDDGVAIGRVDSWPIGDEAWSIIRSGPPVDEPTQRRMMDFYYN